MDSRDDAAPDLRMMARLNWLLMAALLAATVLLQGRWITSNVLALPVGSCDVQWFQGRGVVAVACVGRDMVRVWPFPVEAPWFENSVQPPGPAVQGEFASVDAT